jgi:hypothetical protein
MGLYITFCLTANYVICLLPHVSVTCGVAVTDFSLFGAK